MNRHAASSPDAQPFRILSGRRLFLARLGWIAVFALTLGLFAASIPAYYDSLVSFSDPELDAAAARASLEAAGVSMDFYARYLVPISVAYTMVFFVVGTVIFWRRSDNWIALFASMCLITMGTFGLDTGPADALANQVLCCVAAGSPIGAPRHDVDLYIRTHLS